MFLCQHLCKQVTSAQAYLFKQVAPAQAQPQRSTCQRQAGSPGREPAALGCVPRSMTTWVLQIAGTNLLLCWFPYCWGSFLYMYYLLYCGQNKKVVFLRPFFAGNFPDTSEDIHLQSVYLSYGYKHHYNLTDSIQTLFIGLLSFTVRLASPMYGVNISLAE